MRLSKQLCTLLAFLVLDSVQLAIAGSGAEKCAEEPPLLDAIANTEVTAEGKETMGLYMSCLAKECEDMTDEVMTAVTKGVPGTKQTCPDLIEAFTCDIEFSAMFEVFDAPTYGYT